MVDEALVNVFIFALIGILFVCIAIITELFLNGQLQRALVQLRLVQLRLPEAAQFEPEEEPEPAQTPGIVIGRPAE
jgi:hypothetical protein